MNGWIVGSLICVALNFRGIRYFGPCPTLALVFAWLAVGSGVTNYLRGASRLRWFGWAVGAAATIGLAVWLRRAS